MMNRAKRSEGKRVKTGCDTCRVRKIKCDEGKPNCQRCCQTGRKCGWVSHRTTVTHRQRRDGSKSRSPTRSVADTAAPDCLGGQLSIVMGPMKDLEALSNFGSLKPQDRVALEFYRCVIREQLTMGSGKNGIFWGETVMQAVHQCAAARYGVIALSHAYRQREERQVLSCYNQAIKKLTTSPLDVGTTMLVSFIFCWLEKARGNQEAATRHFRCGLTILNSIGLGQLRRCLFAELVRMDYLQFFIGQRSPNFPAVEGIALEADRPFKSYTDAQTHIDSITSRAARLARMTSEAPIPLSTVAAIRTERAKLNQLISSWQTKYNVFCILQRSREDIGPEYHATSKATAIMASVLANLTLSDGESTYDQHSEAFKECVIVISGVCARKCYGETTASFGNFAQVFMYFVATKCRILRVRVAALQAMADSGLGLGHPKPWNFDVWYAAARRTIELEHCIDLCRFDANITPMLRCNVATSTRLFRLTQSTDMVVSRLDSKGTARLHRKVQFIPISTEGQAAPETITEWLLVDPAEKVDEMVYESMLMHPKKVQ